MNVFTIEKLKLRIPDVIAAATRATQTIELVRACIAPGAVAESAMAPPPPADAPDWKPLRIGERWGEHPAVDPAAQEQSLGWGIPVHGGSTHWLRVRFSVPEAWRGQSVLIGMTWQGGGQASLEGIAYLDGQTFAGIDEFHRSVLLPPSAHRGDHDLLMRCYLPYPQRFEGIRLILRDDTIFQLGQMLRAATEAVETYPGHDPNGHTIVQRLNAAYNLLDLRDGWQSLRFAESAHAAFAQLRNGLTAGLERGQRPTLLATGHAHLDVAWLWPLWRTHQKVAHTVATALHLMERYPDYHFSMSQPQVYAFLKQDDPELYARLKERVADGRFEPVGMMWLEPDCNIPSGESLVRHMTHGARFFADEFGEQNHVVWLPDVFGYSAALPQIMRGCGVNTFMTTKISWNQFNRMPNDTFRWRGIDGTEVLTHFVTATSQPLRHPSDAQFYTYVGKMTGGEVFGTWNHYRQKALNDELLYIFGWGDGGGGPTEDMLEAAKLFHDLPNFPQVQHGRTDGYFARLYKRVWDDPRLPTWSGELYLEYHRGTYTSQARIKQANRAAELLLREAEWLNAWASVRGADDQQAQIDQAWQMLLLNQFHDILPGSSVPQVYVDSNAQHAEIQRIVRGVRDAALAYLRTEDAALRSGPVVVNSLPWARHEVVTIPLDDTIEPRIDGPTQIVEDAAGARALLALVDAPPYSIAPLLTAVASSPTEAMAPNRTPVAPALHTSRQRLESDLFRLELDDHGEIAALYDRVYECEIVLPGATANQLVCYEDRPMNWDAWDIDLFYEEKPYPLHTISDWRVVETGPLRSAVAITRPFGHSRITQRICLWAHARRIDIVTEVDWQERQTLLRALFPLNINTNRATCEIQFGAVERPTHRNTSWDVARFEVCAHRWVDLSEGDYGVALLNTGKYGHSLHHTTVGLSLLKGAIFPDPDADRGHHHFTYSLLPHAGDWRTAEVVRRAYELNAPLRAVLQTDARPEIRENRSTGRSPSFVTTTSEHVVTETIKRAHDGDGLIVRLYEAHNRRGHVALTFDRPVASAEEVDLLERAIDTVDLDGATVRFDVRPFEIKTVRVRF